MTRRQGPWKQRGRTAEAARRAARRPRILAVEDSPTQAEALLAVLQEQFDAVLARTGEEAIRVFDSGEFELVISDIVMPGKVDGYRLCRHVKTSARAETPVVLLTSLSDPMDIIRGLECGADNFLTKPYEPEHLLSRLDFLLSNRTARAGRRLRTGVAVYFMGRQFVISAGREQILDLLISTFEDAVRQNSDLKKREAELARSQRTLGALYELAISLQSEETERGIIATALDRVIQLPPVKAGWIWLYDGAGGTFNLAASRGLPSALQESLGESRECYCQRELAAGRLGRVKRVFECEQLRAAGGPVQVHASVPLSCGGHIIGVMNLLAQSGGPFSDADLTVLYGVGNQIAFAIERARLWNNMGLLVERRTEALRAEVAERQRAEEALQLSDSILRRIGNLVVVAGGDGQVKYVSPSVETVLGYRPEDLLGDRWWELTFAEAQDRDAERALVRRVARGELPPRSKPYERAVLGRDGRERLIMWSDSKGPGETLIGVGYDVTDMRRLEEQFRQAQKMEAVGRLAGGIAHDFNNILTAIIGYADLLNVEHDLDERARAELGEIKLAADRASRLTRQLLAFSRRQVLQPQLLNLNDVVTGFTPMLKRLLGESISLSEHLAPDVGTVEADPGQVEQVIMNLALNARDAMPGGGTLTIETGNVVLDESYAEAHPGVSAGHYVLLAVSDTGHGMDEDVRARVFEPFFTTKPPGQGTGLGLATVYGIVNQSGGHVWVYSEPGHGTTMKVYLPRQDRPAQSRRAEQEDSLGGGSETILLVEDDPAIRALVTKLLSRLGYTVIEAGDGASALAIVRGGGKDIDLLLTDVVLPRMSGKELALELQRLRPGTQVLFMSGYTDETVARHGILEPGVELIEKPFAATEIASRVRHVLDARGRR